jgi:hypothetical protein
MPRPPRGTAYRAGQPLFSIRGSGPACARSRPDQYEQPARYHPATLLPIPGGKTLALVSVGNPSPGGEVGTGLPTSPSRRFGPGIEAAGSLPPLTRAAKAKVMMGHEDKTDKVVAVMQPFNAIGPYPECGFRQAQ